MVTEHQSKRHYILIISDESTKTQLFFLNALITQGIVDAGQKPCVMDGPAHAQRMSSICSLQRIQEGCEEVLSALSVEAPGSSFLGESLWDTWRTLLRRSRSLSMARLVNTGSRCEKMRT